MLFVLLKKELKELFRDFKNHFMMIVFPITLMFIIGTALFAMSGTDIKLREDTKPVAIYVEDNQFNLENFGEVLNELNIIYEYVENEELYLSLVNVSEYSLLISYTNNEINLYHNPYYDLNNQIVKTALQSFLSYQLAINEIINEGFIPVINEQNQNFIINNDNQNNSFKTIDYYGITMLILIICYTAETYDVILNEYYNNTIKRLELAPINRLTIFFSKLIAVVITIFTQITCVVLFASTLLKVNYGNNYLLLLAVLYSLALAFISMGMALIFILKDDKKASSIINSLIVIMGILSGLYFEIDLGTISNLSPITYVKKALFELIYFQNINPSLIALLANLFIFIICVIFAAMSFRKNKEVIKYV